MRRFSHIVPGGLLSLAVVVTTVHAEAIRIQIPQDAPLDLPTIIGVPYEIETSQAATAVAVDGLPRGHVIAQFVPDLDMKGKPRARGTLWLPITVTAELRGKTLPLTCAAATDEAKPVIVLRELEAQATQFIDGDRLLMQYNHGPKDLNGKIDPDAVLGFVHPITGLDGEVLSQHSPGDHLHHRGLFWAWVRYHRDGKNLGDWWTRKDIRYRFNRILHKQTGPLLTTLTAEGFLDRQTKTMETPERLVREVVTLRAFARTGDHQAIDIDIDLYAMVDDLTMAGQSALNKGYGGLTLRLPKPDDVRITADGKHVPKDADMYRAHWADYSGSFPKTETRGPSGAAIFTHPDHPDAPPGWCLRYYGPINPSYPGLEFVPLHQDKPLRLQYRLVLHRGDAGQARLVDLYALYATRWSGKR
ncbi:MAG: PmoA family protein [Phycisphaerae bacterium]|nr:PmoA family protein [Phycisphaerae bacterium]